LPSDQVTPAGRTPGDRDDRETGAPEGPEGGIGLLEESTVLGYGVVDIEECITETARLDAA
jgi:hypothetical protein